MYIGSILKRIRNLQNVYENFVDDIEEDDDIPEEDIDIFNPSSYIFWIIIIFLVIGVLIISVVVYKLFYSNANQVQYYDTPPIQQPIQKMEEVQRPYYNQNQYSENPTPLEKYQPKQQNIQSSENSETTLPKYDQAKSSPSSYWSSSENSTYPQRYQ